MNSSDSSYTSFPYTQIRVARPTHHFEAVIDFYKNGLGLTVIGSFTDHNGISGIMMGLPHMHYHLEFTYHENSSPCPPPTKDNLLVFYLRDTAQRDTIAQRLFTMGYPAAAPQNPYWEKHGITIEDPDGWRIVLMDIPGFNAPQ